ncbi:MAG: lactate dehydrogenase [Candidatus Nealsonbacteria bacterium]|nr:lactate dehydrogenase [Candidatus Nealsonbacteria bacterium]
MRISLIGTGRVGSTLAFQLLLRGLAEELVLVDRNREIAEGEALDLQHAEAFTSHPMAVRAGELSDTAGSDLIVISCSVPWSPDYASRFDIGRDNLTIFKEIVPPLAEFSPDAKILVVSNPVDVMTYHVIELSGFGPNRVFGTGTLIDSGRFRALLSKKLGIHPDDLRAYILGEHGDTQFPVFGMASAGGARIAEDAATHELSRLASLSGYDVVHCKGHTNFAISMAATLVVEAIAWDTRRTMPLSVHTNGFLGIDDVCLSLPVVVGKEGITQVLHPDMGENEIAALKKCARTVRHGIEQSLLE